ncbi:four helix bundle protein [Pontibacter saemangeumensis]|uniref:Four helix bundle protein n=1 Tax=Pontibacter saemangeumensis TaxID=1084525 RepID=A0ABP8LAP0_9BACT
MINGKENLLYEKAYAFAVNVVEAHQYLGQEKREYILAGQLLRSGTSIGASVVEANSAVSEEAFLEKLALAYQECQETKDWLDLLKDTRFIEEEQYRSLYGEAEELCQLLSSSIRSREDILMDNA